MPSFEDRRETARIEAAKRGQVLVSTAMIPPPLDVRPELTDDDVAWLNEQMALTGRPSVRFARSVPLPPPAGVTRHQCS